MKQSRAVPGFEILLSKVGVSQLLAAFHQKCSALGGINSRKANRESFRQAAVSLENRTYLYR